MQARFLFWMLLVIACAQAAPVRPTEPAHDPLLDFQVCDPILIGWFGQDAVSRPVRSEFFVCEFDEDCNGSDLTALAR